MGGCGKAWQVEKEFSVKAMLASLLLVVALFVASVSSTAAAPADDAYAAYQAGDCQSAFKRDPFLGLIGVE